MKNREEVLCDGWLEWGGAVWDGMEEGEGASLNTPKQMKPGQSPTSPVSEVTST
jgi:hypothetical protein